MLNDRGLPSGQYGVGDDRLNGDAAHDRLDGGRATISLNTCPEGRVLASPASFAIPFPSASCGWRRAVRALGALTAALPLLLGAGGVAAEGTLPMVSVSDAEAYEDGRYVHFEVSLSQPSSEQVTVEVATSSGTARSGADFRAEFRTVTFPADSTDPQSVLVSLRNDRTREPDETFTVTLSNPVGATLGDATATGTIRNDDTSATLAANGIGETTATLTIGRNTGGWWYRGGEYALGPLGYSGQAYRILRRNVHPCTAVPAGTTAVSIGGLTSAMSHDYRAYSDSTCSTRLARVKFRTLAPEGTPTVSVSDAEVSEDGARMYFEVSLSQASRQQVTVRVRTSNGTATSGADFRHVSRTLTFPANTRTPMSVRVAVHDDEEPEPDETFTVRLTNPVGATLGDATATGTIRDDGDTAATLTSSEIADTTATLTIAGHTDSWWYKGNAHACTAVAAGTTAVGISALTTVTDYEYTAYSDSACSTRLAKTKFKTLAPAGTPTVSISDAEVVEGGDVAFAVSLSHPSRERVTVEVHTSSGTATNWYDFVGRPETLTFRANSSQITRYARVKALDDEEPEPDETFTATLRVPVGATLGDATATGTIRDDGDTAATLTASDIEDTTATLTIGGHTGGWWYRGGNAHVCTAVAVGTTAVSISGLTTVTDYEFTAYSDSACSTKLAKVDFGTLAPEGTPTVSISDAEASEDGTGMVFKVSLSHPSRKQVFVRTNTSNGTATGTHRDFAPGIDFRHEFPGMGVIFEANSPRTTRSRSVRVYDDQAPEPDETFTVTLSHPSNVILGDATATGTIRDDGDTAATLTASDIEDTTATLTIAGHTGGWWYHGDAHSCTAVAAGTAAVSLAGLTTINGYDYTAYSDSGCQTKLARVKFNTLAPEGTPTVSVSDAAASEDYSSIRFNVSLSHPSREPVTVWYETSGGTATSGTDFTATSYNLELPANSWNRGYAVGVHLLDDQEPEPDETFTLTLTRATGATLGDATATGTITDNGDTAATLTASDIEDTTATLTISGHTDGWWYRGRAHSCTEVAAGTTAVSISGLTAVTNYKYTAYSGSGCSTKLADVEFKTLAAEVTPTVSISDAEVSEDGARVFFLVSLSHPVRKQVTVDVHTSGGTATSGTDFEAVSQTLTFPANSNGRVSLPVIVHDDQEPEPDETFTVTLTNPTGATLGDATATGTIKDDGDTAATLTASDIEDTTATLTIGRHTDGWWYQGNAHSCTAVAAGTTAVSISGLTTVTDYEYTAYSDSTCSTKLAKVRFRTLAPEGTPTVSVSDAEVSEDGDWMDFEVSLSQPSREQVTVDVRTSGGTATSGTDFKAVSQTLTFPANSRGRVSLPVLVHDDQEPERDETFTLTLANPVGATLGDATATGTIRDDGDTPASLTASDIEDTTATLTIGRHTDGWWYQGNAHACTAVAADTTAVSISGLTAVTDYEYTAYGDSACNTKLANVEFRTLAPEGTPTVSISDAEVSEDGTWMPFRVSLSQPSRNWVSVQIVTSDGTATGGTDFRAGSGRVWFFPNSSEVTLPASVIVHDDQEPEPDETFTVTLTNPLGATLGDATATGTILDDDSGVTLAVSDVGETAATLTIGGHTDGWWYKRDEWLGNVHPCTAVTAGTTAVSVGGLTAARPYEYTAFSDSTCATRLAKVRFRTLAPEGTPTVSVSDAQGSEDRTFMTFQVSLSQPSRERVTVDVRTSGETATSGTDFSALSETLTFPANSRYPQPVSVRVYDDQEPEPDETFTVTLTNPTGATLGDATATGTIEDDGDTAATLTPSDIEDTTATLTIGGHTDGWWYRGRSSGTSSPWGACSAVTVGTTAVSLSGLTAVTTYEYWAYGDSACSTKLANAEFDTLAPEGTPTVSISDAEASEDGKWIRFEVSLSQPSREEVWVRYKTLSGTATSGTDFQDQSGLRAGTVLFDANRPQITRHARVKVYDDQEPEPDETFTVTLTSARGATLGDATATGTIKDDGDTASRLTASDIEDTTATLTISDHTESWWYRGRSSGTSSPWGACTSVTAATTAISLSGLTAVTKYEYWAYSDSACSTKLARLEFRTIAPEGTPTVSVSDAQASEDGTWMGFKVSLSQPSREPVTIWYETSDGTATGGTDFRAKEGARAGQLYFSANSPETAGHASVRVHDDQDLEPDETFTVTLTSATGATLGDATATGTILDDDSGVTLAASDIEDTTTTLTIGGHTDGWWFKGNAHACTAVPAGATAVSLAGLTSATSYDYRAYSDSTCNTRLARVAFLTLAVEGVTPTVSVSDAEVSESGGRMQFWVSLSQPSRAPVTVDVQTSDGTATSGTDYRTEAQTLTFPANSRERQLLPVLIHDDRDPEPDKTFTVTLMNPVGATLGDATATGTITDDDTVATGVTVVSDAGSDATYVAGDAVRVAVTFDETVEVDTDRGTPRLKLDLGGDNGAGERWAAYEGGSGTKTLTFAWTAAAPDESAAGVAVLADMLELNGGTIRSAATQADAALGHPGLDPDPAHKVDAAPPELLRGEIDGGMVTLTFSEALDPDWTGGVFKVKVRVSKTSAWIIQASGPVTIDGETATVGLGAGNPRTQEGLNGNLLEYLRRADGTDGPLRDLAGNPLLTPHTPRESPSTVAGLRYVSIDLENVTGKTATVTGAEVVTDAGPDGVYGEGETVEAAVTFDAPVTVGTADGTPTLALIANGGIRRAAYVSGTGTERLAFAYRVVEADGPVRAPVRVASSGLKLTGGSIGSAAGKPASLGFGEAPGVTAVSVETQDGGRWEAGDTVEAVLTFAEPVTVEGAPSVGLVLEGAIRRAVYAAGSGTDALAFRYTLEQGDGPWARAALAGNSLRLDGGSISSAGGGLAAALGHAGASGAGEADPPAVTGVTVVSDAGSDATYSLGERIRVRVAFSEAVAVTGSPGIAIDMDPAGWGEKRAVYESGSGTDALMFVHEVVEPNLSRPGIAVLADTLILHGGATIRSAATQTDALLGHTGLGHDSNHKVDWRLAPVTETSSSSGPPSVTGVEVVSDAGSDSTYLLGDTIRVRLAFSEAVKVTGSPTLAIDMDPAEWGTKRAAYEGATGTAALALTFAWTVVEPNFSTQGIAVLANSLALNGGTIRSAAANANAALAHTGLGHDSGHKVDWRPSVSVADARANEAAGATVAFQVSLSRAFTNAAHRVTVDYATADGTAKAGADYTATSGTLTFAAGETSKTVNVPIIDDSHDEGEETFTLRLSNATGARIGDGEATGTIVNTDPIPKAWLARFGRTVADHVVDAVTVRLSAPRAAGVEATLAGHALPSWSPDGGTVPGAVNGTTGEALYADADTATLLRRWMAGTGPEDGPGPGFGMFGDDSGPGIETRALTERDVRAGTSFALTTRTGGAGFAALWGRGAISGFDGRESGLTLDGQVTTGMIGADWSPEPGAGRWTAGLVLGRSSGSGSYRVGSCTTQDAGDIQGGCGGTVAATLGGLYPWAGAVLGERVSVWAAAGVASGRVTVTPDGSPALTAGLGMSMGAAGLRSEVLKPSGGDGFALAFETDARVTATRSDATQGLVASRARVWQVRAGIEGSRPFALGGGARATPSFEIGLRLDGGDAERGTGADMGGGLAFSDPANGISFSMLARGLVVHKVSGFREWGASMAFAWDPKPETDRGLSLSLTRSWGASPSGGMDALFARETMAGLSANDNGFGDTGDAGQLSGEIGYGLGVFGDRFTGTANLGVGIPDGGGRDVRVGWHLSPEANAGLDIDASLDVTRSEPANGNEPPRHGIALTGTIRW